MTSLPGEFAALYSEALVPAMGHRAALDWLLARKRDAELSTFLHDRVPKSHEWNRDLVDKLLRWRYARA